MKKLMMIAAMMLMSISAFAQEAGEMYIKPMVGATFSTITDFDNSKFKFVSLVTTSLTHLLLQQALCTPCRVLALRTLTT